MSSMGYSVVKIIDNNNNGVVDKADGIRVLDEIPSDLTNYSDGDMFKVDGKLYIVDKPE